MEPSQIPMRGAVDLSALKSAAAQPGREGGAAPAEGGAVIDVTEATFQTEVLERSMQVPVVLDFWADWCGPCKQLSPILERLAAGDGGRWVLARIDVDANQRLSMAAGVQGIPAVKAVVRGQIVGEFTGAMPEAQVRQWINEVLQVAAQALPESGEQAPAGEQDAGQPVDPALAEAQAALQHGDLDAAVKAFRSILDHNPGDQEATVGLARVELQRRVAALDAGAVRAAAAERPGDVDAQCQMADLEMVEGFVEDAFGRLVEAVRRTDGEQRDRARTHLLSLFEAVGPGDPQVSKARSALTSALF